MMLAEAWEEAQRIKQAEKKSKELYRYLRDPAAFGMEILGEKYTEEVIAVMNSVRDNPVTIARSANGVGKSHGAARIAVWFFSVNSDAQVYATAAPPLDNLKRIVWGEVMSIVENHPDYFYGLKVRTLRVVRNAKSFIDGVAIPTSGTAEEREAKFAGKHAPHILFIVDEGDAVPGEVYRGIESCMSGGVARLLIMFNPRAKSGPVYNMERDRQAKVVQLSALKHPNVVTGENVIPGAVTREITLRRFNTWTRPLMENEKFDEECVYVPEFLAGKKGIGLDGREYPPLPYGPRKVTEPAFFYMVLGEYPPQSESQLISTAWINAAVDRWKEYVLKYGEVPPPVRPINGVDIAELGTDYNVRCARYGDFVSRMKLWSGIDIPSTTDIVIDDCQSINADLTFIDGTGVGSAVAPSIARQAREKKIDVRAISVRVADKPSNVIKSDLGEFRNQRDQLWWAVREWLRNSPSAMLPPDPYLIEDLQVPTYRVANGKIEIMSKEKMRDLLRRSPDRADALCLTFAPYAKPSIVRLMEE